MTKLISLLFTLSTLTITACGFDAPDEKPERPTILDSIEIIDGVLDFELTPAGDNVHRCTPDAFVGCSDGATNAVFCGEDGRSLVKEECAFGCDADGCNECEPGGRDCSPTGELISRYELSKGAVQSMLSHD